MRDTILKRQNLLLIGLAAVALFCFIYFVLAGQVKSYALNKKELDAESDKLLKAKAMAASISSEGDRLNKARGDYGIKCEPFKKVTRDGSDIIFLGMAAAAGNVAAAEIIPGDIIEHNYTLELPVKVVLQGDYRSLADYCREIENNNCANMLEIRSMKVETITRAPGAKSTAAAASPDAVKATLGIVIFSVKDPEGRLYLEELSSWLTGRGDVFRPAAAVAPAPGLSGSLETHSRYFQGPLNEVKPAETGKTVQAAKP